MNLNHHIYSMTTTEEMIETRVQDYFEHLDGSYSCSVEEDSPFVTVSIAYSPGSERPSIGGIAKTVSEILEPDRLEVEKADSNPEEGYYLVEFRKRNS